MKKLNRTLAVFALVGASVAAWEGGTALIENVEFARAEQKVDSTREQLQNVEDLSTVFRNVAKVIGPSVVQIQMRKTIKEVRQGPSGPGDDFLRRFFQQHEGQGGQGDQGGPGGQTNPNDQNDQNENNDNQAPDDDSQDLQETGTGSGVIMEVDGSDAYIVTNNHVAGGATDLTVTLADGRTIKGTTLGADAKSDLAIVKISADHLIAAKWGDSEQLDQGDWVLAFGSPFGYVGSMTHGIVSALNRNAGILGSMGYEHFIQVDAPINPGNSGGPLVNVHGEVVGINTAIATRSGGFQGIGFAIPSSEARTITAILKEKGKITRGWLGVGIDDVAHVKPAELSQLGYTSDKGVFVAEVRRDTPASGKLQPGDIITGINGKSVDNTWQLRNEIAETAPGTTLKLQVFRDQKQQDISITIGTQPEDLEAMTSHHQGGTSPRAGNAQTGQALGMRLSNLTDDLAQKNDLGDVREGALVTAVTPGSLADLAGLRPGDLITGINGAGVSNVDQAADILSKQDVGKGITFNVTNHEGSSSLFLQKQ
jgi:serine protease Do